MIVFMFLSESQYGLCVLVNEFVCICLCVYVCKCECFRKCVCANVCGGVENKLVLQVYC